MPFANIHLLHIQKAESRGRRQNKSISGDFADFADCDDNVISVPGVPQKPQPNHNTTP